MKKKKNIIKKISFNKINLFFKKIKKKIYRTKKIKGRRIHNILFIIHHSFNLKKYFKNIFLKSLIFKQNLFISNNIYFNFIKSNLKLKFVNIFQKISINNFFNYSNIINQYSSLDYNNDFIKIQFYFNLIDKYTILDDTISYDYTYNNFLYNYFIFLYKYIYVYKLYNIINNFFKKI